MVKQDQESDCIGKDQDVIEKRGEDYPQFLEADDAHILLPTLVNPDDDLRAVESNRVGGGDGEDSKYPSNRAFGLPRQLRLRFALHVHEN